MTEVQKSGTPVLATPLSAWKRWVARSPDKAKAKIKRDAPRYRIWAKQNPEKVLANTHRYRARKALAHGSFTLQEWRAMKKLYQYTCLCCKRSEPQIRLQRDHIIPLVKGGNNTADNMQPLCQRCNAEKGTKTIDYRPTIKTV